MMKCWQAQSGASDRSCSECMDVVAVSCLEDIPLRHFSLTSGSYVLPTLSSKMVTEPCRGRGDTHVLFRILGSIITATGSWSSLHFKKAKRKERKQLSPLEWALNPIRKQLVTPITFMILLPNGNTSCQGGHCWSKHGSWLGRTFL